MQSVISGLPESPQIDEVIIVDDGSTDSTAEILQHLDGGGRLHSLRLPVNRGKGYAMAAGASLALGEVILFVDADLHNWNSAFAHQMIKPLLDGQARMVIGYPLRDWDAWENVDRLGTLHWLAGQRTVWRRDLQPLFDDLGGTRFGVETLLNLYYLEKRYSVQLVPLQGLHHPVKLEKAPVLFALGGYARAAFEILRTMALHRRLAWDLVMKA